MNLMKEDLARASKKIGLTDAQGEGLWMALQEVQRSKFNLSGVLLYVGGVIGLLSMTWFYACHLNSEKSLWIALAYALVFFGTGGYFWHAKNLKKTGGVLSCLGILMVPICVYAFQNLLNLSHGRDSWVIEVSTLLVAVVTLYFIRFPFITVLIYWVIWFTTIDLTDALIGEERDFFKYYKMTSMVVGGLLNGLGVWLSRKHLENFAFWSYLFGMFLCWTSLTFWEMRSEWGYLIYFLINCGLLLVADFFHRALFMLFGTFGVVFYVGHLAYVYSNSLMFSYVLGGIGFSIILLAAFLLRLRSRRQII